MFRDALLAGRTVLVTPGATAAAAAETCAALGASVHTLAADPSDHEAVGAELAGLAPLDAVVDDTAARHGGDDPLRAACDPAWILARAAGLGGMIERGGKLVFVAPPPPAEPTRAALENLSRTLSVEWARYGIRPTTLALGERTDPAEAARLVAFIVSEAGDYYAGCRFDLA